MAAQKKLLRLNRGAVGISAARSHPEERVRGLDHPSTLPRCPPSECRAETYIIYATDYSAVFFAESIARGIFFEGQGIGTSIMEGVLGSHCPSVQSIQATHCRSLSLSGVLR